MAEGEGGQETAKLQGFKKGLMASDWMGRRQALKSSLDPQWSSVIPQGETEKQGSKKWRTKDGAVYFLTEQAFDEPGGAWGQGRALFLGHCLSQGASMLRRIPCHVLRALSSFLPL